LPWGAGTPSISSSYTATSNHFQVGRGAPRVGTPRMVGSGGRATGIADARHRLLRRLLSGPRRLLGLALGLSAPLLGSALALLGLSAPRVALLGCLLGLRRVAALLRVAGNVALLVAALRSAATAPVDLVDLRRCVLHRDTDLIGLHLDHRPLIALAIRELGLLQRPRDNDPNTLLGQGLSDVLRLVAPHVAAHEKRLAVFPLIRLLVERPRRLRDGEVRDCDARLREPQFSRGGRVPDNGGYWFSGHASFLSDVARCVCTNGPMMSSMTPRTMSRDIDRGHSSPRLTA